MINIPLYPEGMAMDEGGCNFRGERFFVFLLEKSAPEVWWI